MKWVWNMSQEKAVFGASRVTTLTRGEQVDGETEMAWAIEKIEV